MRSFVCALVVLSALSHEAAAGHHRPKAGTELQPADLDWPSTTQSVRTKSRIDVYPKASKKRSRIGRIAKDQKVGWKRIVASRDKCKAWLELEPRGWICARDVKPSDDPPATTAASMREGTDFVGIDLVAQPPASWPFAWALEPQPWKKNAKDRDPKPTAVRAAPASGADVVRELEPRTLVSVLETAGDYARIGKDEWVALDQLRIANQRTRPDGVASDERWIDVDLEEQVLISYIGDTPVYATLVTTGRRHGTPTGIYRIYEKIESKTLVSGKNQKNGSWRHEDVPFTMYFRKRYALHGAYWHDRFGNDGSMGCVNLAPSDARWIYDFVGPDSPAGWTEVRVTGDSNGTPVRIFSARDRDPDWKDEDGETIN
jgi:lipoprotein-anchoring transpeptidase ErfK/SrfK